MTVLCWWHACDTRTLRHDGVAITGLGVFEQLPDTRPDMNPSRRVRSGAAPASTVMGPWKLRHPARDTRPSGASRVQVGRSRLPMSPWLGAVRISPVWKHPPCHIGEVLDDEVCGVTTRRQVGSSCSKDALDADMRMKVTSETTYSTCTTKCCCGPKVHCSSV